MASDFPIPGYAVPPDNDVAPQPQGPSNITTYVGDTDPFEWVQKFEAAMTLNGETDLLMCRTFPTLLGGRALTWYTTLPTGSIASWDDLESKFQTHFATSRPGLDSKVQVHILMSGLRQRAFAYELARHEITDLEEVQKKAQEFMRIEEYKGSRADDAQSRERKSSKNKDQDEEDRKIH
ncbi:uncharacterized protein LOC133297959 [Gastrolobium bilobum]|uniref:uncharacterized protein LOC133297959 n=1 Tax=Gastrolobium bilobum TaxID=150636 RepID=UPI002AAF32A0|nr:uncharacterized protein LOC133297959 [Gastrolobium bilobum]